MPLKGSQDVATDPADLGLLDARALLAERRLSSLELTEACLAAIERRNGGPPSFDGSPRTRSMPGCGCTPTGPAHAARAADERRDREGAAAPALCGIPIAVKDLYGVAGLPLTASSAVLEGNVASEDAAVWARLETDGMVLLGHTHTHEFAAGGTTDQVGNPWALDRVAGGSSGGSAAARRRPHDARRAGIGHLWLAADPLGVLRHERDQAHARPPAAARHHPARRQPRPSRSDGAHDRRLLGAARPRWPPVALPSTRWSPRPRRSARCPRPRAPGLARSQGLTIAVTDRAGACRHAAGDRRRARRRPHGL